MILERLTAEISRNDLGPLDMEMVKAAATMLLRSEQLRSRVVDGSLPQKAADEMIRLASELRRTIARLRKQSTTTVKAIPAATSPLRERLAAEASVERVDDGVSG